MIVVELNSTFKLDTTGLVWSAVPVHEKSEYGLQFYFWPYFSVQNYQKQSVKTGKKIRF
jgi:hypothetical protein